MYYIIKYDYSTFKIENCYAIDYVLENGRFPSNIFFLHRCKTFHFSFEDIWIIDRGDYNELADYLKAIKKNFLKV